MTKLLRRAGNDDCGSKPWIENQIIVIIRAAMVDTPAKLIPQRVQKNGVISPEHMRPQAVRNHSLALSALMQLARLRGYVVEKKQSLSGTMDLAKLSKQQLSAFLQSTADQLAPGERQRLIGIADGTIDAEPLES